MAAIAAGKSALQDFSKPAPFQSLSKEEFLGAAAGFLTYRLAVLVSEVASEVRTEDWLSILPGSIAESYRRWKGMKLMTPEAVSAIN